MAGAVNDGRPPSATALFLGFLGLRRLVEERLGGLDEPLGLRLVELPAARKAEVAGEFNEWGRIPLTRRKDGRFSRTVTLQAGREYRFRYLLDGQRWENDEAADAYVANPYGSEDSVLVV